MRLFQLHELRVPKYEAVFDTGLPNDAPLHRKDLLYEYGPTGLKAGRPPNLRFTEHLDDAECALLPPIRVMKLQYDQIIEPLPARAPPFRLGVMQPFVCQEAKDIIERFAPDTHQFIETKMTDWETGTEELYTYTKWYYFNNLVELQFWEVVDFYLADRLGWRTITDTESRDRGQRNTRSTKFGRYGSLESERFWIKDCVFRPIEALRHPMWCLIGSVARHTASAYAGMSMYYREDLWQELMTLEGSDLEDYRVHDVMEAAQLAAAQLK